MTGDKEFDDALAQRFRETLAESLQSCNALYLRRRRLRREALVMVGCGVLLLAVFVILDAPFGFIVIGGLLTAVPLWLAIANERACRSLEKQRQSVVARLSTMPET